MSINIGGPGVATTLVGQEEATWFNRTGATRAVGDVLQLDVAQTATETTGYVQGGGTSVFENAVLPEAGLEGYGTFGVVIESGSLDDNRPLNVALDGIVQANISEAVNPGDALIVVAAADTFARGSGATGQKVVAIALETLARAGSAYVWMKLGGHGADGAAVATVAAAILRTKHSTAGGDATEEVTLTGTTADHIVVATTETGTATVVTAVPDTDRVTLTLSADPGAGRLVNVIAIPRA